MILLTGFAFLAGIVTILSPCILPVLPIILSSTIGGQKTGYSRPLGIVIGFVASFTFFTLFLSSLVRFLDIPADSLRLISVAVIIIFGVSLLIPKFQFLLETVFSRLAKFAPSSTQKGGFGSGIVLGFSLGLLWTPCVGPILASVISLAITGTVTLSAFIITFAYSLGTAIPMFAVMIGGQNLLRKIPGLYRNLPKIQKAFGILMILTALGILTGFDRKFQTWVLNTFPGYGVGLTKFEDVTQVKEKLKRLNPETSY